MAAPGKRRSSGIPGPLQQKPISKTPSLPAIHESKRVAAPKVVTAPLRGIYGRHWTSENKRLLHEMDMRSWLRNQGKNVNVDFSDLERTELRRYFEAIAEVETPGSLERRIRVDRLEDMLISLGLASSRGEVDEIVTALDDTASGELDFEQFLTIVRTREDPAMFQAFKAMIDGKLGDRNLNFRTVISGYRRRRIMEATGARLNMPGEMEPDLPRKQEMEYAKMRGKRILDNFANLQQTRFEKGEKRGDRGEKGEDAMAFDGSGHDGSVAKPPTGFMQKLWHTVCQENDLEPHVSNSTGPRLLERPRSPSDIIESIVKGPTQRACRRKGTLIIGAPNSLGQAASCPDLRGVSSRPSTEQTSRPGTREGNREIRVQPIFG